ncbi:putative leucine-rich repeat receptor-like protein kinase [Acorus calamus]|uniref:non-specific serine/threonine protein kinase n=1 Tax=Acorus calamus TaxID=4465 RepID=A0AAV9FFJ2_ACOCL|nr:putative leucine-rich repeat receptor-like protein kinase [Acorus calamus]
MMGGVFWVSLLASLLQLLLASAYTNPQEVAALTALTNEWQNVPPDWVGTDPCGSHWTGINCSNSHIVTIVLTSMGLKGTLTGDLQQLTELTTLDLSYNAGMTGTIPPSIGGLSKLKFLYLIGCGFSGEIPGQIGSLKELVFLSLNSNSFTGQIPSTIGKLSKLNWLDLSDNKLTGTIPVSSATTPGLDSLINTQHFHLSINMLSGSIPDQLFSSSMRLIHLLLNDNNLTGSIPSTLCLLTSLEVLRLDRNSLTGPVPVNLNNLMKVGELHLSHNKLTGPLPNLTGMSNLTFVDMSDNIFDASEIPPWFSTLKSLTTLMVDNCRIGGELPESLFSLPELQTVSLQNNRLTGTLYFGTGYSSQLQKVDVQNNSIQNYEGSGYNGTILLMGNPFCQQPGANGIYCSAQNQMNTPYSTGTRNCVPIHCPSNQDLSPNCKCAFPYSGTINFYAPSFSNLGNPAYFHALESYLLHVFSGLPVDSVSLNNVHMDELNYLEVNLQIFPSEKNQFNQSEIAILGFLLSNQNRPPPRGFGPYFFNASEYAAFAELTPSSSKSSNRPAIIGASMAGFVAALLIIGACVYAIRERRRVERLMEQSKPFAPTNSRNQIISDVEDTERLGMVYKGTFDTGQVVAIKRAQQGSLQGELEFKTEIELLSRVHHRNLVSLLGFCFDQGELILVYEYVPNGSLKQCLTGELGVHLDWKRRLRVALGAAKGLTYLHELANPPIIHRDIKSNNILLDEQLNAKVADFGLSKPMDKSQKDQEITQVKGTMGYLDPEYYLTQQLTEKSDVYSFGVLLFELLTGKKPIDKGRYIVREVKVTMDKTKDLYDLHGLLDPRIGLGTSLGGFEKFVDLALKCVEDLGVDRPAMSEVVKEIECIMQQAGANLNVDSFTASFSFDGGSGASQPPYSNDSFFNYSGSSMPSHVEPK